MSGFVVIAFRVVSTLSSYLLGHHPGDIRFCKIYLPTYTLCVWSFSLWLFQNINWLHCKKLWEYEACNIVVFAVIKITCACSVFSNTENVHVIFVTEAFEKVGLFLGKMSNTFRLLQKIEYLQAEDLNSLYNPCFVKSWFLSRYEYTCMSCFSAKRSHYSQCLCWPLYKLSFFSYYYSK